MLRQSLILTAAVLPVTLLAACGGPPNGAAQPQVAGTPSAAASSSGEDGQTAAVAHITEPAHLKGLTAVSVRDLLGPPGFRRRDAPAEIWQYRGRNCTLDLFLYDGNGGQTVGYYAVRSPNAVGEKDCFDDLVQTAHPAPAG